MQTCGTLYLIPVPLGGMLITSVLPAQTIAHAQKLGHFVAENAKTARIFLKAIHTLQPLQSLSISELNEHTRADQIEALLTPLLAGHDVGLISEAGCPAVADPGALLVEKAHDKGIKVVPLTGPSSLLLALMASGLNGQRFAFHGYLPRQPQARNRELAALEKASSLAHQTQIFIEPPYRNESMFISILDVCQPQTRLCLATELTLPGETIITRRIDQWRQAPKPSINRRPSVFLLLAQ